ncbi:MAG TPA: type 4a pilus biogenesis protein PilO [Polyangiaceae bacterium]|nr:type 4a pilus biogenesis protein PilO [Polyangiaceae bacterium]
MARQTSILNKLPLLGRVGVGIGLLALVGIAYFVLFFGDIESSIKAAHGREQQLRTDLADARKNEFSYQKDLAELTDRQQRQRELNKVLPVETEYPAFLSAVQSVANVSGIGLTSWTPQPEVNEQFYSRVPMKVTLVGRYHQVAKFFYGVGQLDRIINMENISLTEPKVQGDDVVVKTEALATAFRAVEDAKATSPADKRGAAMGGTQ